MRIDGKRAIVTGASSGIGRAIAISLASRGAALTLAARRRDRLETVAREIAERFPSAQVPAVAPCDVSDPAQVSALIGGAIERFGDVDVLVNNAGRSVFGEEKRTSLDDYRALMAVNFYGALFCMREVLPFMLRRESGLIVNVATTAALYGVPYLAAYGASKAALVALSQSLRAELDGTGVRVMLVYPGYTDTEIFEVEKRVGGARRPPGTYASAESVANAVVRGIESGGRDVFLTARGKALNALRGLAPFVVDHAMRRIARELKDGSEPREAARTRGTP